MDIDMTVVGHQGDGSVGLLLAPTEGGGPARVYVNRHAVEEAGWSWIADREDPATTGALNLPGREPRFLGALARLAGGNADDREVVEYTAPLPCPLAAMCMKAYAYRGRSAERDAIDVWRLAEVAHVIGLSQEDWPDGTTGRESAAILT